MNRFCDNYSKLNSVCLNTMVICLLLGSAMIGHAAPTVDNGSGATPGVASATLEGEITAGGPGNAYIYWGLTDGGTDKNSWDNEVSLGSQAGVFSTEVTTDIWFGPTYYYRAYATNGTGGAWAGSTESFTTVSPGYWSDVYVGINFRQAWNRDQLTAAQNAGAVVAHTNWNNSDASTAVGTTDNIANPTANKIVDSTGADTGFTISWDYEGTWYNRGWDAGAHISLMNGYLDLVTTSHVGTVTVTNIPPSTYHVYAYFGADADGRTGTVSITGSDIYSFRTYSDNPLSFPAAYTQTIESDILSAPNANYAVWSNLTMTGFTLNQRKYLSGGPGNVGLHGLQIIIPAVGSITNNSATGVTSGSANMKGTYSATGSIFDVYVYWGTNDAGTDASSWVSTNFVGSYTNVTGQSLSYAASSLTEETTYYYTFRMTNATTNIWASPSASFSTTAQGLMGAVYRFR